jgi:HK97 family phage portal protein
MPKLGPLLKADNPKKPGPGKLGTEIITQPISGRPHVISGIGSYAPPDAFRQKRPPTSVDLILAWRLFTFWCVSTVSQAFAQQKMRLYAIQKRGAKPGRFQTKALSMAQLEGLQTNATVSKYLAQAAKVEEVTDHPFLDLLKYVNPWMNQFQLLELICMYQETVGASYLTFVKGFGGVPIEIWPLPAWLVYVQPAYAGTGVIAQYVFTAGGGQRVFGPEEILYQKRTSLFDPYTQNWSPLRAAYDYTSFADKLTDYDESRLSNWSRPDAVLESEEGSVVSPEEAQRINSWFRQSFAMTQNGGIWVAPGGMTLRPYVWPNFDPGAEEKAKQTRYNIARSFDIPVEMVDAGAGSRANLDATLLRFGRFATQPRCRRFEEDWNSNVLPLYDDRLFIAFDTAVPADKVLQRETHKTYVGMGVMSINETRLELGLAPVEGADELMIPAGLTPLSVALLPPAPVIPAQVEGVEPDEVPTAAQTAQTSDRSGEKPKPSKKPAPGAPAGADDAKEEGASGERGDKEEKDDDKEFEEGENLEASTREPKKPKPGKTKGLGEAVPPTMDGYLDYLADLDRREKACGHFQAALGFEDWCQAAPVAAKASDTHPSGVMVALFPEPKLARQLAVPGGEPWDEIHLTLAYLGKREAIRGDVIAAVQDACEVFARSNAPLEGRIAGLGLFDATAHSDGKDVIYARPDVPGIGEFREQLARTLTAAGAVVANHFPFTPHLTLAYVAPGEFPDAAVQRVPVRFAALTLSVGGVRTDYLLTGAGGAAPPQPAGGAVSDAELAKALRVLDLIEEHIKGGPAALAIPFRASDFEALAAVSKIDEYHDPHSGRFTHAPGSGIGSAGPVRHEPPAPAFAPEHAQEMAVHAPFLANPSQAKVENLGSRLFRLGGTKPQGHIDRIFGRPVPEHELASIVGAPNDSTVRVGRIQKNQVTLHWKSPDGEAQRTITRNTAPGDQSLSMSNDSLHLLRHTEVLGAMAGVSVVPSPAPHTLTGGSADLGAQIFGRQVAFAQQAGMSRIDVKATRTDENHPQGKSNGYFVWPLFGFNGEVPPATFSQLFGPARRIPQAKTVGDLMKTTKGREEWKAHGMSFNASFDLAPGSRSQQTWTAYMTAKRAKLEGKPHPLVAIGSFIDRLRGRKDASFAPEDLVQKAEPPELLDDDPEEPVDPNAQEIPAFTDEDIALMEAIWAQAYPEPGAPVSRSYSSDMDGYLAFLEDVHELEVTKGLALTAPGFEEWLDVRAKHNPNHDARGRFTTGSGGKKPAASGATPYTPPESAWIATGPGALPPPAPAQPAGKPGAGASTRKPKPKPKKEPGPGPAPGAAPEAPVAPPSLATAASAFAGELLKDPRTPAIAGGVASSIGHGASAALDAVWPYPRQKPAPTPPSTQTPEKVQALRENMAAYTEGDHKVAAIARIKSLVQEKQARVEEHRETQKKLLEQYKDATDPNDRAGLVRRLNSNARNLEYAESRLKTEQGRTNYQVRRVIGVGAFSPQMKLVNTTAQMEARLDVVAHATRAAAWMGDKLPRPLRDRLTGAIAAASDAAAKHGGKVPPEVRATLTTALGNASVAVTASGLKLPRPVIAAVRVATATVRANRLPRPDRESLREASKWIESVTDAGEGKGNVKFAVGRTPWLAPQRVAYQRDFLDRRGKLTLPAGTNTAQAVHGLAHVLEHRVPGWNESAQAFLKHRVGDEPLTQIRTAPGVTNTRAYRRSEYGRADNWGTAFGGEAHYVGKDHGKRASEVTAMGLEKLFTDPVGFARRDPEHAKFILGMLDGSLRGLKPKPPQKAFGPEVISKIDEYHDPHSGRFASAPGGAGHGEAAGGHEPAEAEAKPETTPREFGRLDALFSANKAKIEKWDSQSFGGWAQGLTHEEHAALRDYRKNATLPNVVAREGDRKDYVKTTHTLREAKVEDTLTQMGHLDSALAKAVVPESVIAYRGIERLSAIGIDPKTVHAQIGHKVKDLGYMSMALDPRMAVMFQTRFQSPGAGKDGAVFKITIPKGSAGVGSLETAIAHRMASDPEHGRNMGLAGVGAGAELLAARGHSLRITAVERRKKRLLIHADLVAPGEE